MERYTARVTDLSGETAQLTYAKALQFYMNQGLEGRMYATEMGESGLCLIFYTNTEHCWRLLRRYMTVQVVSEKEAEMMAFADSALEPNEISGLVQDVVREFDYFEEKFGHKDVFGKQSYSDILRLNLRRFCYYIAAADGILNENEADMLNIILDENLSYEETIISIQNAKIVDSEDRKQFEESTLSAFVIAALADKVYQLKGEYTNLFKVTRNIFRSAGIRISVVDGEVSQEELESIDGVLRKLSKILEQFQ